MHDGNAHALGRKASRGFEAKEAAADHDRPTAAGGRRQHGVDIVEVAEGDDAGQIRAGHGDDDRHGAGRHDQLVIGFAGAIRRTHGARRAVDRHDRLAAPQRHLVRLVPGLVVNDDVGEALLTGEHRRKHDAIVIDARLRAEDGHVILVRGLVEEFVEDAARGHSVSNDNQFLAHRVWLRVSAGLPSRKPRATYLIVFNSVSD